MDIKEHYASIENKSKNKHPWELVRCFIVCNLFKPFVKPNLNVVDVGCGDLFFVDQFNKKHPSQCIAVDSNFSKELISSLKSKLNNNNIRCLSHIKDVAFEKGKADVVFLMDVIEHISDDSKFLNELIHSEFVDDQTIFVIAAPAFQPLFSKHDIWIGHFRRYSNKALETLVKKSNLEIIDTGYFFLSLLIFRYFSNLFDKICPRNTQQGGTGIWKGNKLVSFLTSSFLKFDYFVFGVIFKKIGLKVPGLSTYVICRKVGS